MSVEIQPYFAEGERYPALIGVRAEGDEYETAYVNKSELADALVENVKLQDELELANDQCERAILELLDQQGQLEAENDRLREQMERLVTLLRVDCDIDASWDGLRRFWSIELTENGCLMRDRACKAEAENAKLRELCAGLLTGYECGYGELCKGCTWDGIGDSKAFSCLPRAKARDLGVEVDA